jgi:hypothetical protein
MYAKSGIKTSLTFIFKTVVCCCNALVLFVDLQDVIFLKKCLQTNVTRNTKELHFYKELIVNKEYTTSALL